MQIRNAKISSRNTNNSGCPLYAAMSNWYCCSMHITPLLSCQNQYSLTIRLNHVGNSSSCSLSHWGNAVLKISKEQGEQFIQGGPRRVKYVITYESCEQFNTLLKVSLIPRISTILQDAGESLGQDYVKFTSQFYPFLFARIIFPLFLGSLSSLTSYCYLTRSKILQQHNQ